MFLPAFFAFTGLRTEIGLLQSVQDWLLCGVIIVVATVGKFGGTTLAAQLTGLDWRDSAALGILMNTRGLVELIVLNIGLDLGVITPAPVHDAGDHGARHDHDDVADPDGAAARAPVDRSHQLPPRNPPEPSPLGTSSTNGV